MRILEPILVEFRADLRPKPYREHVGQERVGPIRPCGSVLRQHPIALGAFLLVLNPDPAHPAALAGRTQRVYVAGAETGSLS